MHERVKSLRALYSGGKLSYKCPQLAWRVEKMKYIHPFFPSIKVLTVVNIALRAGQQLGSGTHLSPAPPSHTIGFDSFSKLPIKTIAPISDGTCHNRVD